MTCLKKNKVVMSNALARSSQKMTLHEKRILTIAISKIDSRKKNRTDNDRRICVSLSDISDTFDIERKSNYKQSKNALIKLEDRTASFIKHASLTSVREVKIKFFEHCSYNREKASIDLIFSKEISKELFNLKRNFTQYYLSDIYNVKSFYSSRFFEILMSKSNSEKYGTSKISLSQLKYMLCIPGSYLYNNIKERIIERSVTELNTNSSYAVDFKEKKEGRKIRNVIFNFKCKQY